MLGSVMLRSVMLRSQISNAQIRYSHGPIHVGNASDEKHVSVHI